MQTNQIDKNDVKKR